MFNPIRGRTIEIYTINLGENIL